MSRQKPDDFEAIGSDAFPRSGDPWPSPTATGGAASFFLSRAVTEKSPDCDHPTTTIVPPAQGVPLEPNIPNMIADAVAALSSAMRNVRAAEDWIGRAQSLIRKVRERS